MSGDGMKHGAFTQCVGCRRGMMHAGDITFFRLRLERFVLDTAAVRRQHGLELMMGGGIGGAVLAHHLGPNEDLAKRVGDPDTVLVCQSCALNPTALFEIYERAAAQRPKPGEAA